MIRTMAISKNGARVENLPIDQIKARTDLAWHWIDFSQPTEEENETLKTAFGFHPLSIEDCLHFVQRPKMDHYDEYHFFVLHALNQHNLTLSEADLFVGEHYIVSYHKEKLEEIDQAWLAVEQESPSHEKPMYAAYKIIDKLVDAYFPAMYKIDENIRLIEDQKSESIQKQIDEIFKARGDLLRVRQTFLPMRDLLYRVLNSQKLAIAKDRHAHFADIYDHLLKLCEMLESSREMTSDLRDSYISLNANRMNSIMMTLTVITLVFMPLTFIVGLYGMNFQGIPELHWTYGYLYVWGLMAAVTFGLAFWIKRKGWLKN